MKKETGKTMKNTQLMKRFAPYFKKYYPSLAIDLFCAGLTTIGELVLPLIVKRITNTAINDISQLTVRLVLTLGGVYILLRIIDAAAYYYMTSYGHIMGTKIESDMRADLFAHLQKLPFSYYDDMKVGQLMSRITNDLFEITEFAHHCPEEFFIAGVKITATFIILCNVNVPLTLILFAVLPLMLICTVRSRRNMRLAFKKRKHELGEINSQAEDSLLGIRVVKSFANEDEENRKFAAGNKRFFKAKAESYKYMGAFHSTTRVFEGLMYIVIVVIGALYMIKGKISPADYTAYLLYVSTLLLSIKRIVEFSEQFENGMTGIERFVEIMDTPVGIKDSENAKPIDRVRGDVTFDNVTFKYSEEKGDVLSHINLEVRAGENVAIVGPSGSGKTTLCSLIPRFYELTGGRILIDGKDIRDITLSSLRSNIGVVQQDVYLFSGTVRENIAYGKPGATDDEIVAAARLAGAHEFIESLPDGYDTYVGERGVMLSGGQKQRISIARVFVKNPPILILDEATSALDNESELLVQHSLSQLAKGRTTFTIAHRLTTIKNATVIIVLTENGIEEKGTHEELMAKKGIYYELYSLYEKHC
ncbi:MAG: ABC transporter ATP-binding protein [Acutalibacteraceae bacterium]